MAMYGIKGKEIGEVKQYWLVMINVQGFESVMLAYGTHTDMLDYMGNSFRYSVHYRYRRASDEDVAMAKSLGIKAYIC